MKCKKLGCEKAASYGWASQGVRSYCGAHKRAGQEYLKAEKGDIRASLDHVPKGLDYAPHLDSNRSVHHGGGPHCVHRGCTKKPSYGFPGDEPKFCCAHKGSSMVLIPHKAHQATDTCHVATHAVPAAAPPPPSAATAAPPADAAVPHAAGSAAAAGADASAEVDLSQVVSPLPNHDKISEAVSLIRQSVQRHEGLDVSYGMKYLNAILTKPQDERRRVLKQSNHYFSSNVYLVEGMRKLFEGLGFVSYRKHMVLHPLRESALMDIAQAMLDVQRAIGTEVVKIAWPEGVRTALGPV